MKKLFAILLFLLMPVVAFPSGINYCNGVAVTTDTAFCGVSGAVSHACGVAVKSAGGGVEPLFYANWTTNSPAVDDEMCLNCGGCPGVWDTLAYSGTTADVSGGMLNVSVPSDVNRTSVQLKNGEGQLFYGTSYKEAWFEIGFKISKTTGLKASSRHGILIANSDIYQSFFTTLITDASGNIYGYGISARKDNTASVTNYVTGEWTPSIETLYVMKAYIKASSIAGANDGSAWCKVGSGTSAIVTNVDNDTFYLKDFWILDSANFYLDTTYYVRADYVKIYITDPGW